MSNSCACAETIRCVQRLVVSRKGDFVCALEKGDYAELYEIYTDIIRKVSSVLAGTRACSCDLSRHIRMIQLAIDTWDTSHGKADAQNQRFSLAKSTVGLISTEVANAIGGSVWPKS